MIQILHAMSKERDSKPKTKIYLSLKKITDKSINQESKRCTRILHIVIRILFIIVEYLNNRITNNLKSFVLLHKMDIWDQ